MSMRQLAPAGAPLSPSDLAAGLAGLVSPRFAVERLRADLAESLGVARIFLTSSGRAGLALIFRALTRLSPRRRVVIPAYTCFSVPAAIRRSGLEVVPCDIDDGTFDFDYDALARSIADQPPLCVVVTHLFGFAADVTRVKALCEPQGVFVIDDAAQALGVCTAAGALGTLGDVGLYSFGRGKGVTCGSGGAVVTNSAPIAAAIEAEFNTWNSPGLLSSLMTLVMITVMTVFLRPSLYRLPAALPFLKLGETEYDTAFAMERLSGAQAGLLKRWRQRLTDANAARAASVAALRLAVARATPPGTPPCIRFPLVCASRESRDRLYSTARRRRLGFSLMYPTAVSGIPEIAAALDGQRFPRAERLADRLLTIPVHPFVSARDRHAIVTLLSEAAPWLAR